MTPPTRSNAFIMLGTWLAAAAGVFLLALAGCGEDEPNKNPVQPQPITPAPPETTRFVGYFADGELSGPIRITIPVAIHGAPALRAAAALRPGPAPWAAPSPDLLGPDVLTIPATAEIRFSDTLAVSLQGVFQENFQSVLLQGGGYVLSGQVAQTGAVRAMFGYEVTTVAPAGLFVCYLDGPETEVYSGPIEGGPPPGGGSIGFILTGGTSDLLGLGYVAGIPERVYLMNGTIAPYGVVSFRNYEEGDFSFYADARYDRAAGTGEGTWLVADAKYGLGGSGRWNFARRR